MFQGSHPYRIDDKGRLKMPAEFVRLLGTSFTITKGANGCLWVLPQAEWQRVAEKLRGDSLLDQKSLAMQRWFVGSAVEASLDPQGRLAIPPVLREYAGIQHEVMVMGVDNRVEVWSRAGWDAYQSRLNDELMEELARGLGI